MHAGQKKGDKMAVPVMPDFAAGLAAAVGQLSSAKLVNEHEPSSCSFQNCKSSFHQNARIVVCTFIFGPVCPNMHIGN